jgi:hypothetical protein
MMNEDEQNLGGGSGGDTGMTADGNQIKSAAGTYQIGGNRVVLVSRPTLPPAKNTASRVILLAGGSVQGGFMDDGTVDVRGCNGVRVTSGQPSKLMPFESPEASSDMTDGIELVTANNQTIMIQRGALVESSTTQTIELTATGIYIDAQVAVVSVKSATKITLSVAGGATSFEMTPTGITMSAGNGVSSIQLTPQGTTIKGLLTRIH